jgi:phosphoenolpyruvate synthase/pyruvate phosphate dikinase
VGGKGANLGELTRAGFPVPVGFCVTTAAYREFLVDLAAKQANVERGSLLVAEGKVSHPLSGRSF